MKHLIWSANIDMNDWLDYCEEEELNPESNETYESVYDMNSIYFEDECDNCNVDTKHNLVIFATLGRWDGPYKGYRCIPNNISDAFCSMMDAAANVSGDLELFVEDDELKAIITHHDGTNTYTIREMDSDDEDEFADYTPEQRFEHTTPLGDYFKSIYGWE